MGFFLSFLFPVLFLALEIGWHTIYALSIFTELTHKQMVASHLHANTDSAIYWQRESPNPRALCLESGMPSGASGNSNGKGLPFSLFPLLVPFQKQQLISS